MGSIEYAVEHLGCKLVVVLGQYIKRQKKRLQDTAKYCRG